MGAVALDGLLDAPVEQTGYHTLSANGNAALTEAGAQVGTSVYRHPTQRRDATVAPPAVV